MVSSFSLARLPVVHFGIGKASLLPGLIVPYGRKIILVTGRSSFMKSVNGMQLIDALAGEEISYHHVVVSSEPTPSLIDDTVSNLMHEPVSAVVSIGGGSVIDAGKAISAMLYKKVPLIEYLEVVGTKVHPGSKVPFIALPTTSGTGSEATKNAVITETGINGFKRSIRHDNFVPDIAVVDPLLSFSCPPAITASSGMDCFTQLTEAFLSVKANEYTDSLAISAFMAVKRSLMRCYSHPDDREARSDMSYAAFISGLCLANAGLGAVHGLAGDIGAMYNIPHGLICGTLMAAVNEENVRELRKDIVSQAALKKYAELGKIFSDFGGREEEYYIDSFVEYLYELTDNLKLPKKMDSYGLRQEDVSRIGQMADLKNNPVKLSAENIQEIFKKII
jgi:alcohol dehydrogenase class IV